MFARIVIRKKYRPILWDVVIIFGSVWLAFVLADSHMIVKLIGKSAELGHFGSFVSGMFFTSIFTTPLAIVALSEIASLHGALQTALWAACGAVVGDLVIFHFVRDRFSKHLQSILAHQQPLRRIKKLFHYRFFRYLTFLAGGLIIASPFPDEIGVGLLGFSRVREIYFIPLSFGFNFLGVLAIGLLSVSAM